MGKIEIDNLEDLIKKNYPVNYVKKIINDVLALSMLVKNDYPDYKQWFLTKQVPGLYDGSRNIIVAHIDDQIVGFVSLKKDNLEQKICTFYIAPMFRKNRVGSILTTKAIEWLECDKPLITIPTDKIGDFIKISKKYDWVVTDIKDGLYRTNNPEIILNGTIKESNIEQANNKIKTKSISHIYYFYIYHKVIDKFFNKRTITN
jgi:hypothetical protein